MFGFDFIRIRSEFILSFWPTLWVPIAVGPLCLKLLLYASLIQRLLCCLYLHGVSSPWALGPWFLLLTYLFQCLLRCSIGSFGAQKFPEESIWAKHDRLCITIWHLVHLSLSVVPDQPVLKGKVLVHPILLAFRPQPHNIDPQLLDWRVSVHPVLYYKLRLVHFETYLNYVFNYCFAKGCTTFMESKDMY